MLDATKDFVGRSWRMQPASGNGFMWMAGGSYRSGAIVLQEVTADGAALDPYKIPVVVGPGTANDTLWLSSTGISVLKGAAAAYALEVVGTGQFSALRVNGAVPTLVLRDSDGPSAVAVYNDAGNLRFSAADPTTGEATNEPVTLDLSAPDYALVLNSAGNLGLGTATPLHKLDVVGNIALSGDLFLGAESPAPTSAGTAGTAGQLKWGMTGSNVAALYLCTVSGGAGSAKWWRLTGTLV
jgi:hypothetical protein